jgi:hypothetical protein
MLLISGTRGRHLTTGPRAVPAGSMVAGDLSDGLMSDAARIRLVEIGEAARALLDDLLATQQPAIPWR